VTTTQLEQTRTSGSLAETAVAELLAEAYNFAFTGTLTFQVDSGPHATLRLANGSVREASGTFLTVELERESLTGLLPPDLIELAERHAEQYSLGLMAAVERLKLLPPNGLAAAREACVVLGLRAASELPGSARYTFAPGPDEVSAASSAESALEPLNLIVMSLLADPRRQRVEQCVSAFADGELSIDSIGARSLLATLSGPVRPVVEQLTRAPRTVQELRERLPNNSESLLASIYALWLTHHLRVRARDTVMPKHHSVSSSPPESSTSGMRPAQSLRPPSLSGAPPHTSSSSSSSSSLRPSSLSGAPPRTTSSSSLRPSTVSGAPPRTTSSSSLRPPAVSGAPPATTPSVPAFPSFPPAAAAARQELVKERSLEDKAVEAWSLFQADPASLDRVAAFIRKASAVFPRNARMRFFSGCLYEHQGRINEAISEFERVLAVDPRHSDAQRELRRLRGSLSPPSVGDRIKRLFGKD
jgi:hypothetical protein